MVLGNTKDTTEEVIDTLNIVNLCQEFNTLPHSGGILDQDQLLVRKMSIVLEAQEEKRKRDKEQREREAERKRQKGSR